MASLDLKPQWHLPSVVGAVVVLPKEKAWGLDLAFRREGKREGILPAPPSGPREPGGWCGEGCLPPVSAPWTHVLFQIKTTVLTGHVPTVCLGPRFLPGGGFPLGWAQVSVVRPPFTCLCRLQLGVCAAGLCQLPASSKGSLSECQEPDRVP